MELYFFYEVGRIIFSNTAQDYATIFRGAILWGFFSLLVLFIFQGIGLYTMAKRRNMRKRWLAFVPFASLYYMGKLAGECAFFGHKMKNAGLYAMLAQIASLLFSCAYIFAEAYLYIRHGKPQQGADVMATPYWTGLTGFSLTVSKFYDYASLLYSIIGLVSEILLLALTMGLYKKYAPRNYMVLSILALFVPAARFITIFVLRNRKAIDYEAYMRARREEYMRRRQQQYGGPYGNPYGNPYSNPYGNPYAQGGYSGGNAGQYQPPKQEEPFAEFSSDNKTTEEKKDDGSDGFFD
jgi:hypothetical protein